MDKVVVRNGMLTIGVTLDYGILLNMKIHKEDIHYNTFMDSDYYFMLWVNEWIGRLYD